jgi:hypothetical protein
LAIYRSLSKRTIVTEVSTTRALSDAGCPRPHRRKSVMRARPEPMGSFRNRWIFAYLIYQLAEIENRTTIDLFVKHPRQNFSEPSSDYEVMLR